MFCPLKVFLFLCIVGMVLVVNIIFFSKLPKFRSNIFFIMNNTPGNAQRQGAEPRRASILNAFSNPKPHFLCKHSNFWFVYAKGKPKEPSLWFATEIKIFEQYEDGKNSYILIPYSKSTYDGIYGVINTAKQRINFYKY